MALLGLDLLYSNKNARQGLTVPEIMPKKTHKAQSHTPIDFGLLFWSNLALEGILYFMPLLQ